MKIKKIVLLLITLFTVTLYSQTEKGKFLIGGTTNFGSSYLSEGDEGFTTSSNNFVLASNVGYSFTNNFFGGLNIQFLSNNFKVDFANSESQTSQIIFAPFLKYYFMKEKFRPFAIFRYGIGKSTDKRINSSGVDESKSDLTKLNLGGGVSYFFTDFFSLEFEAFYQRDTTSYTTGVQPDDFKFYGIGTSLGFSIFL